MFGSSAAPLDSSPRVGNDGYFNFYISVMSLWLSAPALALAAIWPEAAWLVCTATLAAVLLHIWRMVSRGCRLIADGRVAFRGYWVQGTLPVSLLREVVTARYLSGRISEGARVYLLFEDGTDLGRAVCVSSNRLDLTASLKAERLSHALAAPGGRPIPVRNEGYTGPVAARRPWRRLKIDYL